MTHKVKAGVNNKEIRRGGTIVLPKIPDPSTDWWHSGLICTQKNSCLCLVLASGGLWEDEADETLSYSREREGGRQREREVKLLWQCTEFDEGLESVRKKSQEL